MSNVILRTDRLVKQYNNKLAVDNVTMTIEKGKIYGFIGENGAGKTTTIRIIMGLTEATSGSLEIFGEKTKAGLIKARKRIGTLVERPILFLDMTARENLELQSILYGQKNKEIVDKLLKRVGLFDVGNKKVKDFSLGMKQRLGIAMALVQEPKFLILDEPVNGLDPTGMIDVRELLISLKEKDGITIIISSHILAELYQLATDYIIISNGRIVAQLTLDELNNKCSKYLSIQTDSIDVAVNVIKDKLKTANFTVNKNTIKIYDSIDDVKGIAQALFDAGVVVTEFKTVGKTLEEYYIGLLGGRENG